MDPGTLGNDSNNFMQSFSPEKASLRQPCLVLDKQAVRHAGSQVGGQRRGSCTCSCPSCSYDRVHVCGIGDVRVRLHAGKQAGRQPGRQAGIQADRQAGKGYARFHARVHAVVMTMAMRTVLVLLVLVFMFVSMLCI